MATKFAIIAVILCCYLFGCSTRQDKCIRIEIESFSRILKDRTCDKNAAENYFKAKLRDGCRAIVIRDYGKASIDDLFCLYETVHGGLFNLSIETEGGELPFRAGPIEDLPFDEFSQTTNLLLRVFIRTDGIYVGADAVEYEALRRYFKNKLASWPSALEIYAAIGTPLQSTIDAMRAFSAQGGRNIFIVFGYSDKYCNPSGIRSVSKNEDEDIKRPREMGSK